MTTGVVAVVTAAGSARRFGGRKLLTPIDGQPLLDRTIRALLDGGAGEVRVVIGRDARADLERDVRAMDDVRVVVIENDDPERGMFSSIQDGVRGANADLLLVMPGDMPFVRADTVRRVIATWAARGGIVSPRHKGKRGHPVALPAALRDEILATETSLTLHDVIKRHVDERSDLDVDDAGIVKDVDRPEDLA